MTKKSRGELFFGVTAPQNANSPVFVTDDLAIIRVVVSNDRAQTLEGLVTLSNYLKRKWSIVATTTTPPQNNRLIVIYTLYKPI
jgi:hypothetical protein